MSKCSRAFEGSKDKLLEIQRKIREKRNDKYALSNSEYGYQLQKLLLFTQRGEGGYRRSVSDCQEISPFFEICEQAGRTPSVGIALPPNTQPVTLRQSIVAVTITQAIATTSTFAPP